MSTTCITTNIWDIFILTVIGSETFTVLTYTRCGASGDYGVYM